MLDKFPGRVELIEVLSCLKFGNWVTLQITNVFDKLFVICVTFRSILVIILISVRNRSTTIYPRSPSFIIQPDYYYYTAISMRVLSRIIPSVDVWLHTIIFFVFIQPQSEWLRVSLSIGYKYHASLSHPADRRLSLISNYCSTLIN